MPFAGLVWNKLKAGNGNTQLTETKTRDLKLLQILTACLLLSAPAVAQHPRGDNTNAADFALILKAADIPTRDLNDIPTSWSLKKYAPPPGNQGHFNTCTGWSTAYAARTISYAIQRKLDNDSSRLFIFSPEFIYNNIKPEGDTSCLMGSRVNDAMKLMAMRGAMLYDPAQQSCNAVVKPEEEKDRAFPYRIKDFLSLTAGYSSIKASEIQKIKKSISMNKPVVISLKTYPSFDTVSSGFWNPVPGQPELGAHAMCIVGYDDQVAGGAFEVLNSWGTEWGNKGYWWITYDQLVTYGNFAVELMDRETDKLEISGSMSFISVQGRNMPVIRTKINTSDVTVSNDKRADYSFYRLTDTLRSRGRFKMKFSTNSPSYVYVFAKDQAGVVSRLFPADSTISAAINSKYATYYFPTDSTHAVLDAATVPGVNKEIFCVLYSKSPVDFETLIRESGKPDQSVYKVVKELLGNRLLEMKKINFEDEQILFRAPADPESVVCFFVQMDHH